MNNKKKTQNKKMAVHVAWWDPRLPHRMLPESIHKNHPSPATNGGQNRSVAIATLSHSL